MEARDRNIIIDFLKYGQFNSVNLAILTKLQRQLVNAVMDFDGLRDDTRHWRSKLQSMNRFKKVH